MLVPMSGSVTLEDGRTFATGWLPPVPDLRDYTVETPSVVEAVESLGLGPETLRALAESHPVDLRKWCSEIEDQEDLGSCTAHAAVGIVEYLENRAYGEHIDGSRLFVYKTTRRLMGRTGDTGAWLRNTMGALVLCGVPPEKYWPYTTRKTPGPGGEPTFDDEPPAFVYAVADNFESTSYFCHDPLGRDVPRADVLASVKRFLAAGVPSMFGFYGFPSFGKTSVDGGIPYPGPKEKAAWGHAVMAVGYDDTMVVDNTLTRQTTEGALLIRNSWGTAWGEDGYGWLPYRYVETGLALDFWSLFGMRWAQTGHFGF